MAISVALCNTSIPVSFNKKHSIDLLLGSVEKYMTDDPEGTFQKISAMGYKELE